ncbi:MAG: NRDE family protein [Gammaproteobacteria bacterium]|nr:NRDE family protein [Gammaproteobacteria bacterium]
MCLIAVAWRSHPQFPLVIAANRDEFHARPTAPVHVWDSPVGITGGRDLEAGGTWLGVNTIGRIAAVTNVRSPAGGPEKARSRGELPVDFLTSPLSPQAFANTLEAHGGRYRGFNLLLATRESLLLMSNQAPGVLTLPKGVHAISNAPPGVDWPKTVLARATLGAALAHHDDIDRLCDAAFTLLADSTTAAADQLPDTGLPRVKEQALSSIFIAGREYGTRCSSVLVLDTQGMLHWRERRFAPAGRVDGESSLQLSFDDAVRCPADA